MARRSANDYLKLFLSLLPKGKIWARAFGSTLSEFFLGLGAEFSRVDGRGFDLLKERNTLATTELLSEHEFDLGLPDNCTTDLLTTVERRNAANVKLITRGKLTPQHYIDVAARYGYNATVVEYGEGDPEVDHIFKWKLLIEASRAELIPFRAGEWRAGDSINQAARLLTAAACYAQTYKPAHTFLIVDICGGGFSRGFGPGFDSLLSDSLDYLQGGFAPGFGQGFDVYYGGGFNFREFGNGFDKPK